MGRAGGGGAAARASRTRCWRCRRDGRRSRSTPSWCACTATSTSRSRARPRSTWTSTSGLPADHPASFRRYMERGAVRPGRPVAGANPRARRTGGGHPRELRRLRGRHRRGRRAGPGAAGPGRRRPHRVQRTDVVAGVAHAAEDDLGGDPRRQSAGLRRRAGSPSRHHHRHRDDPRGAPLRAAGDRRAQGRGARQDRRGPAHGAGAVLGAAASPARDGAVRRGRRVRAGARRLLPRGLRGESRRGSESRRRPWTSDPSKTPTSQRSSSSGIAAGSCGRGTIRARTSRARSACSAELFVVGTIDGADRRVGDGGIRRASRLDQLPGRRPDPAGVRAWPPR